MKTPVSYVAIAAAATLTGFTKNSEAMTMKVSDLASLGVDQAAVIAQFSSQFNKTLDLADLVEVQRKNEGAHIRMEAADHLAILVPILNARGPYNKDLE